MLEQLLLVIWMVKVLVWKNWMPKYLPHDHRGVQDVVSKLQKFGPDLRKVFEALQRILMKQLHDYVDHVV